MKRPRSTALASAALITTLLLAGCVQVTPGGAPETENGSSPITPAPSAGVVNMADEMFLMMMIPHHEQAIEMSDLLLGKSDLDPRVVDLAQQIKDAQGPEIETMKTWLEDWGVPYVSGGMGGMDHGGGMMSDTDMSALAAATGAEATRLFLEGMIEHHEGAIDMAQSVLDNGVNSDVGDLARRIIDSQTAEIDIMRDILAGL